MWQENALKQLTQHFPYQSKNTDQVLISNGLALSSSITSAEGLEVEHRIHWMQGMKAMKYTESSSPKYSWLIPFITQIFVLWCGNTSIVEFRKLSVLKPFFQHCRYPPCCLIRLFWDPFQSHEQVAAFEANVSQQIFLLSLLGGWWEVFLMLSQGKSTLWTKPVPLSIWAAQELNNLMHFLSFSAFFPCLLVLEGSVQRLNVLLKIIF